MQFHIRCKSFPFIVQIMSVRDEYNERFAFVVDWFDHAAGLVRKYQLLYYPKDSQIEMVGVALLQCQGLTLLLWPV